MTKKIKDDFIQEIDVLHSGLMAIEELLVKKGLVTLKELNTSIKIAQKECKSARKKSKRIHKTRWHEISQVV